MTHPKVISNLCVKKKLPILIHRKDIDRARISPRRTDEQVIPIYPLPQTSLGGGIKCKKLTDRWTATDGGLQVIRKAHLNNWFTFYSIQT